MSENFPKRMQATDGSMHDLVDWEQVGAHEGGALWLGQSESGISVLFGDVSESAAELMWMWAFNHADAPDISAREESVFALLANSGWEMEFGPNGQGDMEPAIIWRRDEQVMAVGLPNSQQPGIQVRGFDAMTTRAILAEWEPELVFMIVTNPE